MDEVAEKLFRRSGGRDWLSAELTLTSGAKVPFLIIENDNVNTLDEASMEAFAGLPENAELLPHFICITTSIGNWVLPFINRSAERPLTDVKNRWRMKECKAGDISKGVMVLFSGEEIYQPIVSLLNFNGPVFSFDKSFRFIKLKNTVSFNELSKVFTPEFFMSEYLKELKLKEFEGPFILGGLSFGGFIALSSAVELTRSGKQVSSVVMLDCWPPESFRSYKLRNKLLIHLRLLNEKKFEHMKKLLNRIYDRGFLGRVLRRHQNQQKSIFSPVSDRELVRKFHHSPSYDGRVLLFKSSPDAFVPHEHDYGWSRFLGNLKIVQLVGHHLELVDRNYEQIAQNINSLVEADGFNHDVS